MAAIDFPPGTPGAVFTAGNGVTYTWNGTLWLASGSSAGGDFCYSASGPLATSATVLLFNVPISGNSGNWYSPATGRFTPPAGRYFIQSTASVTNPSAAVNLLVQLRKNGTIQTTGQDIGAINNASAATAQGTFDANGTDYFDVMIWSGTAGTVANAGNLVFTAFPTSGIKGPPGDLPSGALFMYSEQVLSTNAVEMRVNVPTNAKRIEVQWSANNAIAGDLAWYLQLVQGGTILSTNTYNAQVMYGQGSTPTSAPQIATSGWLGVSAATCGGKADIYPYLTTSMLLTAHVHVNAVTGGRYVFTFAGDVAAAPSSVTALRLATTSGNIVAGSWLRAYVVM